MFETMQLPIEVDNFVLCLCLPATRQLTFLPNYVAYELRFFHGRRETRYHRNVRLAFRLFKRPIAF